MAKFFDIYQPFCKVIQTGELSQPEICLLNAFVMLWNMRKRKALTLEFIKADVMAWASIGSDATWSKCLKSLQEKGLINYTAGRAKRQSVVDLTPLSLYPEHPTSEDLKSEDLTSEDLKSEDRVYPHVKSSEVDTPIYNNQSTNPENIVATSENEKTPAKKRRTQATEFDKEAAEAFAQLFEEHLGRPVRKSADTIRKMRTVDKIPEDQIREAYTYLKNRGKAGQYQCVVLSFKTLREKFTKLQAEMQRKQTNQNGNQLTVQEKMQIRWQNILKQQEAEKNKVK